MHDVDKIAKWWTCEKCNAQVAVSAVVFFPLNANPIRSRMAVFDGSLGEVWKTALLVGSDGLAMREPNYCPNCGARVIEEEL